LDPFFFTIYSSDVSNFNYLGGPVLNSASGPFSFYYIHFTKYMKLIYTAPTKEATKAALDDFAANWESKYSYASFPLRKI